MKRKMKQTFWENRFVSGTLLGVCLVTSLVKPEDLLTVMLTCLTTLSLWWMLTYDELTKDEKED